MKKGFTLIELLAVIVILAIIALIATPIVLNIIAKSKESAQLRSAEMYIKGLETSIATSTLNNKKVPDKEYSILPDGNICLVEPTNNTCSDDDTLKVEMNGEKPKSGTVTVLNGKITDIELTYKNKKSIVKQDGNLVYGKKEEKLGGICAYVSGTEKTAGAKYKCKVKEQMETEYKDGYTFYVLTTPKEGDTTINLIMDQNINSDGTPAGRAVVSQETNPSKYSTVAWISDSDYGCEGTFCAKNDKGPVTAMKFLYNATKDWVNVDPLYYTYKDREIQKNNDGEGYISFISTNGVAEITPLSGDPIKIGTSDIPLRARMPICSNDENITEVTSKTNAPYLYDNLDPSAGANGYWNLSSSYKLVYDLNYLGPGRLDPFFYSYDGVRPVITLEL